MTEETNMADIPQEGVNPFAEEAENEDSEDSPTEKNDTANTRPADGEGQNNQQDPNKDKPFHEHPRWKEREQEWDKRFNEQETRHQEDLKKLREDFGDARKENRENTEIPSWFGGTQETWNAYRADLDKQLKVAEDRAFERLTSAKGAEDKAVEEATAYMQSEMSAIEKDTTINPSGKKVDPNALLKAVMDNELIDTKGRWNYRAGWKILNAQSGNGQETKSQNITDKKKIVAVSTGGASGGEKTPAPFKTSADFKMKRPW